MKQDYLTLKKNCWRCFESGEPEMLNEISITNFAIIEQLDVRFENGLTVLTGETGAGKVDHY